MSTQDHFLLVSNGIRVNCWKMVPKGLRQLRMVGHTLNYVSHSMEMLRNEYKDFENFFFYLTW